MSQDQGIFVRPCPRCGELCQTHDQTPISSTPCGDCAKKGKSLLGGKGQAPASGELAMATPTSTKA